MTDIPRELPAEFPAKCPYCQDGCDRCDGGFIRVKIPVDEEEVYTQKCQDPQCGFENGLCFGPPPQIKLYPCVLCGHPDVRWHRLGAGESLKEEDDACLE